VTASYRARSIGIDDGLPGRKPVLVSSDEARAGEFAELFRAVYLTFHRRDRPRSQLANASLAVLEHLALAGPLTIGEAAAHLDRAQSVVSEIVSHLEHQGLLERESDPADRRRTLIWLTPAGQDALRRQREVLSTDLLTSALSRMPPDQVGVLFGALRALVHAASPSPAPTGALTPFPAPPGLRPSPPAPPGLSQGDDHGEHTHM
jgi:DNA-binding MarR family transcriptional regulator